MIFNFPSLFCVGTLNRPDVDQWRRPTLPMTAAKTLLLPDVINSA
jgi:hypothetical protein